MTENKVHNIKGLRLRAKLPVFFRIAAIGVLSITMLALGVAFYKARTDSEFRMKGFPTALSQDVVASVSGFERREMDGDVLKYYIKADRATTFADNHQELENVFLQVFEEGGERSDQISASKAIYIPAENKNFTAFFAGDVSIATRDALTVKTSQVTYKKEDETASAEENVEFNRENVRGKSVGAIVRIKEKRLELTNDVEIETFESDELAKSNVSQAKLNAGYAIYDQLNEKIELHSGVTARVMGKNRSNGSAQTADVRSQRANAFLVERTEGSRDVTRLELFENVQIDTRESDGKPTKITAGYALYDKDADRFDLRNEVHIITVEDERPTNIVADTASYHQSSGRIILEGNAQITQGGDLVKGDHITADLNAAKKLKYSQAKGNAYLKQASAERTSEVSGGELDAAFNDKQQLTAANSFGQSTAVLTPANPAEYSKVSLTAPNSIRVTFKSEGLLDAMITEGRTTIQLDVPGNASDAANKRITADTVKTIFNSTGKDIARAEAAGNAELVVEPLTASVSNYKTTVNAPRFDCEFFPTGNSAKNCLAGVKTKTVRIPTVQAEGRGSQTLLSDKLNALFSQQTKDVERFDATGDAKFSELDRNAIADRISFTKADETVRLAGGEPTVWDSKARAKGREIDWDTKNSKSLLLGGVSTTYYSQSTTNGAAPFTDASKPVYITAESADFDHKAETAVYSGNARSWQENNYVRGDKISIFQKQAEFQAEGNVQSLLYNAKRKEGASQSNVPVYAAAQKMAYNRDKRVLRYENNVDIRQGNDRISGGIANVYLAANNEIERTDIENTVVITQPNRRASADFAQYTVADESVLLRGNPATVVDAESGSSQGGQLTVYLGQNKVVGVGKSKQNSSGRTRSVYKVKNN